MWAPGPGSPGPPAEMDADMAEGQDEAVGMQLQPPAGEDDEEDMAGELAVGCDGVGDILLHKGDGDRSCTTVVGTATAVQQFSRAKAFTAARAALMQS